MTFFAHGESVSIFSTCSVDQSVKSFSQKSAAVSATDATNQVPTIPANVPRTTHLRALRLSGVASLFVPSQDSGNYRHRRAGPPSKTCSRESPAFARVEGPND